MKFFSKTQILGVALATLVAFSISACDEVKSLVDSVDIEQPLVSIEQDVDNNFNLRYRLIIQSQDDKTYIRGLKANRGNCPVLELELDDKALRAYADAHPDRVLLDGGVQLQTKDGQLIAPKRKVFSNETFDWYLKLDADSSQVYNNVFYKTLPFGQKMTLGRYYFACAVKDIIEIELLVGEKGSITYNFEGFK